MAGWGTLDAFEQSSTRMRKVVDLEFTGSAGAVAGVKGKGFFAVTYVGAGLYRLTLLQGQSSSAALKGMHLKALTFTPIKPAAAGDGGWTNIMTLNTLNTLGVIEFNTLSNIAAAAPADYLGLMKVTVEFSSEAAT